MTPLKPWMTAGSIVTLAGAVYAAQPQGQPPMTPPPEALAACASKALNSACSVQLPDRTLQGKCLQVPSGQTACVPAGGPRPQGQPPQGGQGGMQPPPGGMGGGMPGPGGGVHSSTITQVKTPLTLVPATQNPVATPRATITEQGNYRVIQGNAIAKHKTGAYPNARNPNTISEQSYSFKVPLNPKLIGSAKQVGLNNFGVAVNGVTFDPTAAEAYKGNRSWMYEPLNGAIDLGVDVNYAHAQPNGAYHYHGKPTGLLKELGVNAQQHSPLVGWAADGFPIYALYGYKAGTKTVSAVRSSYRLKQGARPTGATNPGGTYDGTFVQDYAYVKGAGELDECNGMQTTTPEFPQGTYAYFLTDAFPMVPRCFKGTPSSDFRHGIPGMRPQN